MTLITSAQRQKLLGNGRAQRAAIDQKTGAIDFEPVVKLFTPDGNATWLLTELDPNGEYLAFGLCDLGLGEPELGCVSLHELAAARGPLGLPLERDLHFTDGRLSAHANSGVARYAVCSSAVRICVLSLGRLRSRSQRNLSVKGVALRAWHAGYLHGR